MRPSSRFQLNRRSLLLSEPAPVSAALLPGTTAQAAEAAKSTIVLPGRQADPDLLQARDDRQERRRPGATLVERLKMAGDAGFDGVDFDEAELLHPEEARAAGPGVWSLLPQRHQPRPLAAAAHECQGRGAGQGVANIEHCIRVSHAIGGSGVLIVIGRGDDGPADEIDEQARTEIKAPPPRRLPRPADPVRERLEQDALRPRRSPEQSPERFIKFVDSFNSPGSGCTTTSAITGSTASREWLRAFGHRGGQARRQGFSRAENKFVDITSEEDDLPWGEVGKASRRSASPAGPRPKSAAAASNA